MIKKNQFIFAANQYALRIVLILLSLLLVCGLSNATNTGNIPKMTRAFHQLIIEHSEKFKYSENLLDYRTVNDITVSVNGSKITLCILDKEMGATNCWEFNSRYTTVDVLKDKIYPNNIIIRLSCKTGIKGYLSGHDNTWNCGELYFKSNYSMVREQIANALLCLVKVVNNPQIEVPTSFDNTPAGMSLNQVSAYIIWDDNAKKFKVEIVAPSKNNTTNRTNSYSNRDGGRTFKPVKSTITDNQGTFTSQNFNCPNMVVYDKGNTVQLSWGGENIPLSKSSSPDTYIASQSKSGTTMKFVAYRSSSTRKIYLVICTTKSNGKSVEINFKP